MTLRSALLCFSLALTLTALDAAAQKTTRRSLKFRAPAEIGQADSVLSSVPDTLKLPGASIELYGYEKPLRSNKETLHIRNLTGRTVTGVRLEITYLDYKGKELHRRFVDLECDIPPGGTRLLAFPSWDVQKRFYYADGPHPRNRAYPYRVKMTVVHAIASEGRL